MSEMQVDIISHEIVKPSSPTPDHLRIFKRSFIDQVTGTSLRSLISFYPKGGKDLKINDAINQLRSSLPQTLSHYYPLAGTPRNDTSIECNDQGALFVTAKVHCSMHELIGHQPKFHLFPKLCTSLQFNENGIDGSFQVTVQFNALSCGGIAIFFCISHGIADMTSVSSFLKCWASISCGADEKSGSIIHPEYVSASIFPPREQVQNSFSVIGKGLRLCNGGRSIRKRFVFSAAAISDLKTRGSSEKVQNPTSFEVVSSFLWMHSMKAAYLIKGFQQPSILVHSIDLRRRMVPPLPKCSAGNILWLTAGEYPGRSDDKLEIEFERLVEVLRRAKHKTLDEFVPEIQSSQGYMKMDKFLEELGKKCSDGDMNVYMFTSCCKMGLNEVDFGWGRPIWTSFHRSTEVESTVKNHGMLMDGSEGGIEAWLILEESEMAMLESNQDFVSYASPNPGFTISM